MITHLNYLKYYRIIIIKIYIKYITKYYFNRNIFIKLIKILKNDKN